MTTVPLKHFANLKIDFGRAAITFACLETLVVLQGIAAYRDGFFTPDQMLSRGVAHGLPFAWHLAMWGDLLVISPLAAYAVGRYSNTWRLDVLMWSVAIGVVASTGLHLIYIQSSFPEAHVQNHALTAAGWLHAIYMAAAVAILAQFLFFTPEVPAAFLWAISVLIVLHVFVGNHMLLGLIKLRMPLPWYSPQPLKSYVGWATIGLVTLGLLCRSFGTAQVIGTIWRELKWITNQRAKTAKDYLKLLDWLCEKVNFVAFPGLILDGWARGTDWPGLMLIGLVGIIYYLSRLSVKQEMEIGETLFPPGKLPDNLQLGDRVTITVRVCSFLALYIGLAWVADCILVASLILFIIACNDLFTRARIAQEMREDFKKDEFATSDPLILDRRNKATTYLERPHVAKEALRAAGCAVTFGIASQAYFAQYHELTMWSYVSDVIDCALHGHMHGAQSLFAYGILIATLVLNEVVTVHWRRSRDRALGRL